MIYPEWLSAFATIMQMADADAVAALNAIAPRAIEYAELRIYREFDLLATRTSDVTQRTARGLRSVLIPPLLLIVENVNLILPADTTSPAAGTRIALQRASRSFLDATWPNEAQVQMPAPFETYFAIHDFEEGGPSDPAEPVPTGSAIKIAPTPDGVYVTEYVGVFRPAPLSATNQSTILTTLMPDIFLAASLIFGFGYQRDFGQQSSDPQAAVSWEQEYQILGRGVAREEMSKKAADLRASLAKAA